MTRSPRSHVLTVLATLTIGTLAVWVPWDSSGQAQAAPRSRASMRAVVEIDGTEITDVEATPLSQEIEVLTVRSGNDSGTERKVPGGLTHNGFSLTGVGVPNATLLTWWANIRAGKLDRRSVTVKAVYGTGTVLHEHRALDAFPQKLEVDARNNTWALHLVVNEVKLFD